MGPSRAGTWTVTKGILFQAPVQLYYATVTVFTPTTTVFTPAGKFLPENDVLGFSTLTPRGRQRIGVPNPQAEKGPGRVIRRQRCEKHIVHPLPGNKQSQWS